MAEKYMAQHNDEIGVRLKTQDEIDSENNANTFYNGADVAIASKNPYAVAAGVAIKKLDKETDGESTQLLGEITTFANKRTPGGKKIQKMSNKLSESGSGDKIGKAASYAALANSKGNTASSTAENAVSNSSKVANTSKNFNNISNVSKTTNNGYNTNIPQKNNIRNNVPQNVNNQKSVPQNVNNQKSVPQNVNNQKSENLKNELNKNEAESGSRMPVEERGANNPYTTKPSRNAGSLASIFKRSGSVVGKLFKKYVIMYGAAFFFFIIIIVALIAGKDHGNLAMTNNSSSMGDYRPELIGVVTPDSISDIGGESLDGSNGKILSSGNTLLSLLGQQGVDLLNETIKNSVDSVGYGTGAAPAAAAQALIQNLLSQNIVLPYFWGGGHGKISEGADGKWGTYTKVGAGGHSTSYSNQPLGLDCSGFVSWALYNGGCKNFYPILAADFKNLGPSTSFSDAKTGDIAASNSHVVLILENRGDTLLVAEAKGSAYGVVFSERSQRNLGNYKIVNMSNYYQQNCS